jgi:AraC-like DNA-binding protein
MAYLFRKARLLPLQTPLKQLLKGRCYAVEEAVLPGFQDGSTRTNYWAVIFTVTGTSNYCINSKNLQLTPFSLLIMRSNISFSERVKGPAPCHNRYLMLDGTPTGVLSKLIPEGHHFALWPSCPAQVAKLLGECVSTAHQQQNIPCWHLASMLCRLLDAMQQLDPLAPRTSPLPTKVRELLASCPQEHWSVPQVAIKMGMSVSAFAHQFRSEAGMSPAAFIRRERTTVAKAYLEAGMSVAHTSAELGFANPYHFSRVFKKEQGVAPSSLAPINRRLHRSFA